jgi:hypothetical protein
MYLWIVEYEEGSISFLAAIGAVRSHEFLYSLGFAPRVRRVYV